MSNEYYAVRQEAWCKPVASRLPRILVVEDDPGVAEGIRLLLEPQYQVEVVEGGAEALRLLSIPVNAPNSFEVVLCDVMMPGVSGIDLYRQLAQTSPAMARRIIFMTGGAYTDDADRFLGSVDNIQVQKPFNLRFLHQQLQNVIAMN